MIKMYVMHTCPDCEYVEKQVEGKPIFEIIDIGNPVLKASAPPAALTEKAAEPCKMKKVSFILTILLVWVFSACAQQKNNVTPSQNRVGYSAWETQVSYTHPDPLPKTGKPELVRGTWEMNDGILQHKACEQAPLAICNYVIPSDHYTITCTARKDGGPEGFIIVFNYVDQKNYCQIHFGCCENTQHVVEQISGNNKKQTAHRQGSVEMGKWYNVKLTVAGDSFSAWLDDEPVFSEVLLRN